MMAVKQSISSQELIADPGALQEVCRRYHVRRLSLFGSAARGELQPQSDVDLLVEYEPGYTPTLFELGGLGEELSSVFDGRYVDLVSPRNLHWYIRDAVLNSARVIYEG